MTPSSGARSGTSPSRRERGVGDGTVEIGTTLLECGHSTDEPETFRQAAKRLYWCAECHAYKGRKR